MSMIRHPAIAMNPVAETTHSFGDQFLESNLVASTLEE